MGVPNKEMIDIEVKTLRELKFKRAFVMHGFDDESGKGMDEVSTLGTTHVAELLEDGTIKNYTITPEDFGLTRPKYEDIASTFGYSLRKTKRIIKKLVNDGVIFGRFYPYPVGHHLAPDFLKELKKYQKENKNNKNEV